MGALKKCKTNLIEEPLAIMCPSDGRKLHKSKLISEAQVILGIDERMRSRADVDIGKIAPL
jgi:hypothetical protein